MLFLTFLLVGVCQGCMAGKKTIGETATLPPPTETPLPSPTFTVTATPTRTHTATSTFTLTPSPTLTRTATAVVLPTQLWNTYIWDVNYCTTGVERLFMDLYYPAQADGPSPVLVYVHGGGWVAGDKRNEGFLSYVPVFTDQGYLVVAINYRLSPRYKYPAHIVDVKCALRYLRANADLYYLDPDRIAIWGASAGGHLAALAGLAGPIAGYEQGQYLPYSSKVQAVIDFFGPIDIEAICSPELVERFLGLDSCQNPNVKRASPTFYARAGAPPFLIFHGDLDSVVPISHSLLLHDTLFQTGVDSTLVVVENSGHGFYQHGEVISPSEEEILQMMVVFLDRVLK